MTSRRSPSRHGCRPAPRAGRLVVAGLLLSVFAAVRAEAATAAHRQCRVACTQELRLCRTAFLTAYQAARADCRALGSKDTARCRHVAHRRWHGDQRRCRAATKSCRACCRKGAAASCHVALVGDGLCRGTPVSWEECDAADDAACPGTCRDDCACPVPQADVLRIASDQAARSWSGRRAAAGPALPLADASGSVRSYLVPYALDRDAFPTDTAILDAIRTVRAEHDISDPRFHEDLERRIGRFGAVQVAATRRDFPVLVVLEALPLYYLQRDAALAAAQARLGTPDVSLQGMSYRGPHEEYFVFQASGTRLELQAYTLLPRSELQPLFDDLHPPPPGRATPGDVADRRAAAWSEVGAAGSTARRNATRALVDRVGFIANPELVPVVDWTCWCNPTAKAMVAGYYDHVASVDGVLQTKPGFGRVVDFWLRGPGIADIGPVCGPNVPNLLYDLVGVTTAPCPRTNCASCCSWTSASLSEPSYFVGALNRPDAATLPYAFGFQQVDGDAGNAWGWADLTREIDAGRPVLWSMHWDNTGHSMAAIGYREIGSQRLVVVHSTWGATRAQQLATFSYDQWSANDPATATFVGMLTAGGGSGNEHAYLVTPRGGEVVTAPVPIGWQIDGNLAHTTVVESSLDGGRTWSPVDTQVTNGPGAFSAGWAAPTTSSARVRIRVATVGGALIAQDSSTRDFTVGSRADLVPVEMAGGYCSRVGSTLEIFVGNQGTAAAGSSVTRVSWGAFGTDDVATPAIAPGATVKITASMPPGCFDPDCGFGITVDQLGQVPEAYEDNNSAGGICIG